MPIRSRPIDCIKTREPERRGSSWYPRGLPCRLQSSCDYRSFVSSERGDFQADVDAIKEGVADPLRPHVVPSRDGSAAWSMVTTSRHSHSQPWRAEQLTNPTCAP